MLLLLHGRDTFRSLGKLQEIIGTYKNVHGHHAEVLVLPCENLSFPELREHLRGVSLFAKKRLIILKNVCHNKSLLAGLLEEGKSLLALPWSVVVIWEAEDTGATKEERALLALTHKKQYFPILSGFKMKSFFAAFARENSIKVSEGALGLLLTWSGGDSWFVANELRKLSNYKGGGVVAPEDVRTFSSGSAFLNIFEVLKTLFSGNTKEGLALLHGILKAGSTPGEVLYMIGREVRLLALAKEVLAQNKNAAGIPGLSSFVAKKSLAQARRVSWQALQDISFAAYETDVNIKKGALDPLLGLELLSFRFASISPSSLNRAS